MAHELAKDIYNYSKILENKENTSYIKININNKNKYIFRIIKNKKFLLINNLEKNILYKLDFDCNEFESLIKNLWIYILDDIFIKYCISSKNNILKKTISIYWCNNNDIDNNDSYSLKNDFIIENNYISYTPYKHFVPNSLIKFLTFICNSKLNIE